MKTGINTILERIKELDNAEEKYGVRMVSAAFQELEKELQSIAQEVPKAHNPSIHDLKARLANLIGNANSSVSRFQSILPALSRKGWELINMIWKWFTGNLIEVLSRIGNKLGISGYSVGTTAGFPVGLSTSITVHFAIEA